MHNEADLEGANLRDANLTNTNFSEAILSEADLEGALLVGTIFEDVEMPGKEIFEWFEVRFRCNAMTYSRASFEKKVLEVGKALSIHPCDNDPSTHFGMQ